MQKDNSTLLYKVSLRTKMLASLREPPVVLETHGGVGGVYLRCYRQIARGVVIEKDERKATTLAKQRPTWSVYQAEAERGLRAGAGAHLPVNVLDVDPYGEPWPTIAAFFTSDRPLPPRLDIVVNDGLRQKVQLGGAWNVASLREMVARFGNDLYGCYLDVAKEKLRGLAAGAGYTMTLWRGYYCGKANGMTHYWASLNRESGTVRGAG